MHVMHHSYVLDLQLIFVKPVFAREFDVIYFVCLLCWVFVFFGLREQALLLFSIFFSRQKPAELF